MTPDGSGPAAPRMGLAEGRRRLRITELAVWIGYFAVGGNGSLADVHGWLLGGDPPSVQDHDLLAQALNDRFTEAGLDHPVGYSWE